MNTALSVIAVPLITIQLLVINTLEDKPCKDADLMVKEIHQPEWDHDNRRTIVYVEIKNIGKNESGDFSVELKDLDVSVEEVVKQGYDSLIIDLVSENNARASYYDGEQDLDNSQLDYDTDFSVSQKVIGLKPGEKVMLTFYINDLWVYDSNCELRVIIDGEENVDDCDRTNNQLDFFGWG